MKLSEIKPVWGLWLGFVIAPITCALNAALLQGWVSGFQSQLTFVWLLICVPMLFVTGPQGLLVMALLQLWQEGNIRAARGVSLGFGLLAAPFWLWGWHGFGISVQWGERSGIPLFGALLLPFLWSLMFLLFAVFARSPKP